jgi:hypothetical protein
MDAMSIDGELTIRAMAMITLYDSAVNIPGNLC